MASPMRRVLFAALLGRRPRDVRLDAPPLHPADPRRAAGATLRSRRRIGSTRCSATSSAQKKVVEKTDPARQAPAEFVSALGSKYHFLIFWGFIVITDRLGRDGPPGALPVASAWRPSWASRRRGSSSAMIDAFSVAVLALVVFAFFRRIVLQPRLIPMSRDAAAILGAIGLLMLTYFGMKRLEQPFAEICWWAHVVTLLGVPQLPALLEAQPHPGGAAEHLLPQARAARDPAQAEPRGRRHRGHRRRQQWKDFTWKSLLDGFACTECARCTNFCPAYNTGKPLSPMQLIHDVRDDMRTRMPDRGPLDAFLDRFQHGAGARGRRGQAAHRDPHHGGRAVGLHDLRRLPGGLPGLHRPPREDPPDAPEPGARQEKVPADLARTFTNLERNANPWGIGADKRMDWAEGLDVPTLDDHPDPEYLLWVGCAGAFDDRIKKQTRALVEVLREGGVDFAVLGSKRAAPAIRRGARATRCSSRCRPSRTSRRSTPRR